MLCNRQEVHRVIQPTARGLAPPAPTAEPPSTMTPVLERDGRFLFYHVDPDGINGGNEMTEPLEPKQTDVNTPPDPTVTPPVTEEKKFTQADVDKIIKERLEREKVKAEQATAEARAKAEQEALAKNAEWEKLAKQREEELAKINARLAERELADRKREIAEKVGLPSPLATRLVGETDEELEADAKKLLELTNKPAQPKQPAGLVTNPGGGGSNGESHEQRRARLGL